MELIEHRCKRCGGELKKIGEGRWSCPYCACVYDEAVVQKNTRSLHEEFDEVKRETVCNLRRNLYDAVNEEYISSKKVRECAAELKKYLPDDFAACFYEVAVSNNVKQLTKHIRRINVEENYSEIECVIRFLIKSLQTEYLLELNNLVERAYKQRDLVLFEKYSTEISIEAEKVEGGVYETKMPRDVFVAYSSKDMETVSELCEVLEGQGLKCFVAARNLRHGKGSVENYDKLLCEAMDHCKSFVFVSSTNSRSFSCDALTKELPYIQERDIENAPAEHKNNYANMPHSYKKPRVEYRIEESRGFSAPDAISNEFFDGYERVYSPEAVAERVAKQLLSAAEKKAVKKPTPAPAPAPVIVQSAPAEVGGQRIEPLLKRAVIFIDDGEWEDAEAYCEKALDIDPECAQAYIYKLMIDLRVKKQEELSDCKESFEENGNFKKAVRFGDEETVEMLNGYVSAIRERNETQRKDNIYNLACSLMKDGNIDAYNTAILKFGEIPSWKDSQKKIDECRKAIKQIEERKEAERKDVIYKLACSLMRENSIEGYNSAISNFAEIPNWKDSNELAEECRIKAKGIQDKLDAVANDKIYNEAVRLMVSPMPDPVVRTLWVKDAKAQFEKIRGWRDSNDRIKKCDEIIENLKQAIIDKEKEKRRKLKISAICSGIVAIVIVFAIVLNTVIIPAIEENQSYNAALSLIDDGKYEEAIEAFEALDGYKDSADRIEECRTKIKDRAYNAALKLMEEGKYDEAIKAFEALGTYKESDKKVEECNTAILDKKYNEAVSLVNNKKYYEAIEIFEALNGYKDSAKKIEECSAAITEIENSDSYDIAIDLMNEGNYPDAIEFFQFIVDYKDSAEKIEECKTALKDIDYNAAVALMNEGKYAEAIVAFEDLGEYNDTANLLKKCQHFAAYKFTIVSNGYSISNYEGNDVNLEIPRIYKGELIVKIDFSAFENNCDFETVMIPDSVTNISVYTFNNCGRLTSISVDENNKYYKSVDGNLYSKNGQTFIKYATGKAETSFVVPDTVTSIAVNAFYNCTALASVTIPDSVTSIGASSFKGCSSLKNITLPFIGTLKDGTDKKYFGSIFGASAYMYNGGNVPESLKTVTITDCSNIDSFAFYGCTNLVTVSIPKSITRLNFRIFDRCANLESVVFIGSEKEWESVSKYNDWNYCSDSSGLDGRYLPVIFAPECDGVNHQVEIDNAVQPTCTETGLTEGSHCYVCDTVIVAQETVDALGHDEIQHEAKEPTCAEIGWDAYVTCSRCDYSTYVEKPINASNHNLVEHEAKEPNCIEVGWDAYVTCSRCNYSTKVNKPVLSYHNYDEENTCRDCGDYADKGVVFTQKGNGYSVTDYTGNEEAVIIPSTYSGLPVTSIGNYAFEECTRLTSVVIPDSVTSIG